MSLNCLLLGVCFVFTRNSYEIRFIKTKRMFNSISHKAIVPRATFFIRANELIHV